MLNILNSGAARSWGQKKEARRPPTPKGGVDGTNLLERAAMSGLGAVSDAVNRVGSIISPPHGRAGAATPTAGVDTGAMAVGAVETVPSSARSDTARSLGAVAAPKSRSPPRPGPPIGERAVGRSPAEEAGMYLADSQELERAIEVPSSSALAVKLAVAGARASVPSAAGRRGGGAAPAAPTSAISARRA